MKITLFNGCAHTTGSTAVVLCALFSHDVMSRASSNVSRKLLREFLTLNRRLPADQAQQNVDLFRKRAKDLRNATDAAAESEALKELVAKVSFLRIMVPRRAGDKSITAATYIVRDGKLVEGEAERPGLR